MNSFRLKNMKSFIDSGEIKIKPITIFIGKNSSGKSSLVRFPIVLKQTMEESISPLLFYGKYIDYGNYEDVVFDHKEKDDVFFKISMNISDIINVIGRPNGKYQGISKLKGLYKFLNKREKSDNEIIIDIQVGRKLNRNRFYGELEIKRFEMNFEEEQIFCAKLKGDTYECIFNNTFEKKVDLFFKGFIPNLIPISFDNDKLFDEELELLSDLLWVLDRYLSNTFSNVSYIGPFRRTPERNYRYQEASKLVIGSDGSYTSELLASYHRKGDKKFFRELNNWLESHLNIHIDVEDLKGGMYRIVVKDLQTGVENNITDVGFGLSQVLPIIVQVLQKNRGKERSYTSPMRDKAMNINIIEQPELHLHPDAQSNLADLFIHGAAVNINNFFIVETHSEHLILRLRRRILEGTIDSDKVAIYYVERFDENKGSSVKELKIDSKGNIKDWPTDFFDQDYKEIMEINKIKANNDKGEEEW